MKPLSELLSDLASRMKQVEDSSSAVREKNRAALQSRRDELEAAIERQSKEFDQTATQVQTATHRWWADTKDAVERQIEAMRGDFEQHRTEARSATKDSPSQHVVEDAAAAAVVLAGYVLDAAEWAVVKAQLALSDAEERDQKKLDTQDSSTKTPGE